VEEAEEAAAAAMGMPVCEVTVYEETVSIVAGKDGITTFMLMGATGDVTNGTGGVDLLEAHPLLPTPPSQWKLVKRRLGLARAAKVVTAAAAA
jgi:hypothetical protein